MSREAEKSHCEITFRSLQKWQKTRLLVSVVCIIAICTAYIGGVCFAMIHDNQTMRREWEGQLKVSQQVQEDQEYRSAMATEVVCGTYLDYFDSISLRDGNFRAVLLVWFRWNGQTDLNMKDHFRFFSGRINSMQTLADMHLPDGVNYQQVRVDVTISHSFTDKSFPLDSHQLELFLESDLPLEQVRLRADKQHSGMNDAVEIAGYDVDGFHVEDYGYVYNSTHNNPLAQEAEMASEVVTVVTLTRNELGVYFKCFIVLFGTTLWVFIALFVCVNHRIYMLDLIPAALFGAVGNVMVGANALPDSLGFGLLEYVNLWGIMTTIAVTLCIVSINRIRSVYEDVAFAHYYGKRVFWLLLLFVLAGHIIMPLCAYFF